MTTFDNEYQTLLQWYFVDIRKELDRIPAGSGFDGPREIKRREYAQEYQQKLKKLKAKYGIKELPHIKSQAFS
jgi:hypothetical protein